MAGYAKMLQLPSMVTDKNFLRMPLHNVVESDEEYLNCGKWVMFNDTGNMAWIDKVWRDFQVLLEEGCVIMIKASTASMQHTEGSIMCFARPGTENVKRAAEAMRKIVRYEYCMHYKTNRTTESGYSRRQNDKNFSQYKHTFKGRLYRRNVFNLWILVDDAENSNEKRFSSLELNKEILSSSDHDLLPSLSVRKSMDLENPRRSDTMKAGKWIYTEAMLKKDDSGSAEADRLWIVGKRLLDEGVIQRMKWRKISSFLSSFQFYTSNCSDLKLAAKLCDDIMKKANCFCFMYFKLDGGLKCRYLPEGELYVNFKYVSLES